MAADADLWALVKDGREAVLATISRDGRPQLSNVLYVVDPAGLTVRISTTSDRVKATNLARDPRAALHVTGPDFWHYTVAEGTAALSPVAAAPGDDATEELFAVHSAFYGTLDRPAFDTEMIDNRRLVIRLAVSHLYGLASTSGRRPAKAAD
jgi:PPOX class probable F420-dependent enzyme